MNFRIFEIQFGSGSYNGNCYPVDPETAPIQIPITDETGMGKVTDVQNEVSFGLTGRNVLRFWYYKEAILAFLKQEGIPNNQWESMYSDLSNIYKKSNVSTQTQSGSGIQQTKEVVDYLNTTHNDVRQREPRKSIFSEIKKIAG